MKNLEFRAWNDIDKIYIDWATLKASPILFMNIIKGKVSHHTLEQFSGVLDKDGTKIFKNDIVEYLDGFNQFDLDDTVLTHSVVEFREGTFEYSVMYDYDGCSNESTNAKVVGNIHQNKELIKQ